MENFTPLASTIGGVLIGISASMMLLLSGRIAGISGILGGLLGGSDDSSSRVAFLSGLMAGGIVLLVAAPEVFAMDIVRSPAALVIAGVLVGVGTRMGSGCTSGHGVCGLARLSTRSLVATVTFIGAGVVCATIVTQLLGGAV
ncbi:MAG: putative membrane protein YedE/YeeE [Myxococcota bacterium]|jgi:uncharacterized membrane protein YedE/YeeE